MSSGGLIFGSQFERFQFVVAEAIVLEPKVRMYGRAKVFTSAGQEAQRVVF